MKNIYLMRHAQSEANAKKIIAGHLDFPLSAKGHQEASDAASSFEENIDVIFTSTLVRTIQTAAPFAAKFAVPLIPRAELMEHNLGKFAGMTEQEMNAAPDYEHNKSARWEWFPPDGGESYKQVADRLIKFFVELEKSPYNSVFIVTHAIALRLIKGLMLNTLPVYPTDLAINASIIKIPFEGVGITHTISIL